MWPILIQDSGTHEHQHKYYIVTFYLQNGLLRIAAGVATNRESTIVLEDKTKIAHFMIVAILKLFSLYIYETVYES